MKATLYSLLALSLLSACKTLQEGGSSAQILTTIDLVNVENDQVNVVMDFPKITHSVVEFRMPKTVPGTYTNNNYGQFINDFKAWDHAGKELKVVRLDDNRWQISSATQLDKVTYKVNDTYDMEKEGGVFSPTGTNIDKDKNFMLNLHGFVGYIPQYENQNYVLDIQRPDFMYPGTALKFYSEKGASYTKDRYHIGRYFEVTDNPIMYAKPDTLSFKTRGMEIQLSLYSATGRYKAADFREAIVKTMVAQKEFLGDIDSTDKYAILLYLSDDKKADARGSGALEHNQSTVVTFPESMSKKDLEKSIVDVVSHEFFHILTPLNVHSKEIHYFDYNDPKMSKHLWMYEGVTEYFAHLFQIKQGLITEQDFFSRIVDKMNVAQDFEDRVPFTHFSQNILKDEFHEGYYNVYQKGALIGMCLDIQLRESSGGKTGILDLMRKLSRKYGKDKPFDDDKLLNEISRMTNPKIEEFFRSHVAGGQPIPYQTFLNKVGLELQSKTSETSYLFKGNVPYVAFDKNKGQVYFRRKVKFNSFLEELGVRANDVIKAVNGKALTRENYREVLMASKEWTLGMEVELLVEREGKEISLKAKTFQPTESIWQIVDKKTAPNSE